VSSKPLQLAIATAIGKPAQTMPVLNDPIAILNFVEQDCGAEGFTIHEGKLHAVVWRDGVPLSRKTYDIDSFGS
jgi:hypothetical protein